MKFIGGSRCGWTFYNSFNATWPLASLTVEQDGLVLTTAFSDTYQFKKSEITKLSFFRALLFSPGVRIEHAITDYPPYIVFWTFSPSRVKAELIKNGFTID
jgi:hypothetical protein